MDDDDDMEVGDESFDDYYNDYNDDYTTEEARDVMQPAEQETDVESFSVSRLDPRDVVQLVANAVECLCKCLGVSQSVSKLLLYLLNWDIETIKQRYNEDKAKFLAEYRIRPLKMAKPEDAECPVCFDPGTTSHLEPAKDSCGHAFCRECWSEHFRIQISQMRSIEIECMADSCKILMLEDFIIKYVNEECRKQYADVIFQALLRKNPSLSRCPGPNCNVIYSTDSERAESSPFARVICELCGTKFCFRCCSDYHAPTSCRDISKWLLKCRDESETLNYLRANTKDCPKCAAIIEKNGGCNHMTW